MRLLPFRRFTMETPLAPEQVQARLRNAIAVRWTFGFSKPDQPFVGSFDGKSFDVTRYVRQRNSFRPCIRGSIESTASGTRLSGTMQLHHIVLVLMGFLMLAAGSVFLSGAARSVASRQVDPVMLGGLGVLVFLGAMTLGGFFMELNRSVDELARLVDASIADVR